MPQVPVIDSREATSISNIVLVDVTLSFLSYSHSLAIQGSTPPPGPSPGTDTFSIMWLQENDRRASLRWNMFAPNVRQRTTIVNNLVLSSSKRESE